MIPRWFRCMTEAVIPEAPSKLRAHLLWEMQSRRLLPNLAAGLVMGIVAVTLSTAFSALIFSSNSDYIPQGIGLMLVASMVIASLTALISSLRGLVAHVQESAVAILAVVSAAIINQMPSSTTPQERFITVAVAIALSSLLTGALFLSLGQFKLGNLIRYIPYPVIGGFLAGSGLLLTSGAISVLTGAPIIVLFQFSPTIQLGLWEKLVPGLVFAVAMLVALRRRHHALILPGILITGIVVFYLLLGATNTSITTAKEQGWLLGAFPTNGGSLWGPPSLSDLAKVNWSIMEHQIGNLVFVAVVSVIAILLNATGIELATGQDADLNRDLKAAGIANLVAGLTGGMVGYHASGESVLIYKMGARSRLVGLVPATVCAVALLVGVPLLSYFPNPILGGLLLFLGLEILVTWIYDAWFKLPITDYLVIIAILIAINVVGILEGIGLGVVLGIILFVLDYSRISVVKYALSGTNFHSNVNRPRQHEELLRQKGDTLHILELQGFIFFGTAQKLLETVRRRINNRELLPLRFLILDFRLVNGIDSSAVLGFAKIKQLAESRQITTVLTHLTSKMQRQLGDVLGERDNSSPIFSDLDHGVEWSENQLLASSTRIETSARPLSLMKQLEQALPRAISPIELRNYFEEKTAEKGEYIINQGQDSGGLYFIEKGQVTVQLEGDSGKITRLRTMQTGTVVGELGLYLGQKASASVIADESCSLYYLSAEKLKEMEDHAPQIASVFHRFIVGMLSERLIDTNNSLQALTR